jgi:peptidoglycan/xylan/chitin deacetylase (PgdA/CDA1 family)
MNLRNAVFILSITASVIGASYPGWGTRLPGMITHLDTTNKVIALTLDACGGQYGSAYDADLIELLRSEGIQATLFVSGQWIFSNQGTFKQLSADPLFEIENHGFTHRPCSCDGRSAYKIKGTESQMEMLDEIKSNASLILSITGRAPNYYRPATGYADTACVEAALDLGTPIVNFSVISGDTLRRIKAKRIESEVLNALRPGAIIIMHFNHPEWNGAEALRGIISGAKQKGYTFVKLSDYLP